ncbi:hypothetical protein P4H67_25665 [Paenibacillus lautus]|uniref:hypothetical protein n=1 Tax=Paenibacillus lautus TaxID=1401 RepID=UPI002DBC53CB|nr:hypothetical protein [Paenibacillus lautus]MEC0310146.1 hypothetical protein [Paenibacillus lautus]
MIDKCLLMEQIGRDMSDQESRTVDWLNGWSSDTSSTVARLIYSAYENGRQAHVVARAQTMTAEDIQEFVQALAIRYKQVMDAWIVSKPGDEKAISNFKLFQNVIDSLPREISGPFWAEFNR